MTKAEVTKDFLSCRGLLENGLKFGIKFCHLKYYFKDQPLCDSHHLAVTEEGRRCDFQILEIFWHSDSAHMLVFLMQDLIGYMICMNGGSCMLHLLLLWVRQLQFSTCPTCKIIPIHNLVEEHHYQDNVKASTPSYLMPCTPFHTSVIWL